MIVHNVCSNQPDGSCTDDFDMPDTDDELCFPSYGAELPRRQSMQTNSSAATACTPMPSFQQCTAMASPTMLVPVVIYAYAMPVPQVPVAVQRDDRSSRSFSSTSTSAIIEALETHAVEANDQPSRRGGFRSSLSLHTRQIYDQLGRALERDRRTSTSDLVFDEETHARWLEEESDDYDDDSVDETLTMSSSSAGSDCSSDDDGEVEPNVCLEAAYNAEGNSVCSICLENFAADQNICKLSRCAHEFHQECLKTWLTRRRKCPNCRRRVVNPSLQV